MNSSAETCAVRGRWYQLVMDNLDDVAILMTAESGKPLKESKVEATGGCAALPHPGALRSSPLC